ncbi:hypothetical protein tpqmel_0729 [Candidatus Gastranaerophilus sp. (ex Termes propinquus)]|nr:hypothetical protein tpqmel_0729 [Candidatus Gastranaerophilus sp. (ex Termes propinquus)]
MSSRSEYIKTAVVTFLCIVVVLTIVIVDVGHTTHERVNKILKTKIELVAQASELENLYLEQERHPKDFMINLKIAMLHELFEEPEEAGINYEKALLKAPSNPFVMYRFALFNVEQRQYEPALKLIESLPDRGAMINMKEHFYTSLSNAFAQDKNYPEALDAAKIAYKYSRALSRKEQTEARKNLAEKYILSADYFVDRGDGEKAIVELKNSLKIESTNLAKYKLALIYKKNNPEEARKLMEEVFNSEDMRLVNLELYYNLLVRLYDEAVLNSDKNAVNFYSHKKNKLQKIIDNSYVFKDDLVIANLTIEKRKSGFLEYSDLVFDIENRSNSDINRLWARAVIRKIQNVGEDERVFEKKIASTRSPLFAAESAEKVTFTPYEGLFRKKKQEEERPVKISIYVRKSNKSDWFLLYENTLRY